MPLRALTARALAAALTLALALPAAASAVTPPVAAFTANPPAPTTGQLVQFDGSASTAAPGGSIVDYKWDLDGSGLFATDTGSSPTASHTYNVPGTVNVQLLVTDNAGTTATRTVAVPVSARTPTAAFTAPAPIVVGVPVVLDGSTSTDPQGAISNYAWDLDGSGAFATSTGATPTLTTTFASGGPINVRLRVTNIYAVTNTVAHALRVLRPPLPSLSVSPNPVTAGGTATFDASGSAAPDGTLARYQWDLDGSGSYATDTGATPQLTHVYATAGTYPVRLRVTDSNGISATTSAPVVVNPLRGVLGNGGAGPASSDLTPPTIGKHPTLTASLGGQSLQRAREVASRGLGVTCQADRPASCTVTLELSGADAQRLHLVRAQRGKKRRAPAPLVLATAQIDLPDAAPHGTTLAVSGRARKALAKARGVQLTVRGTARDAAGGAVTMARVFLLTR